jgi:hypothetical protein
VIYITEEQAAQVKYLLEQAIQGNHILFDSPTLKRILETPATTAPGETYAAEPHIEKLMSLKGLPEKRAYLERLDPQTFEGVVRTYLNIVENTLFEAKGTVH